MIARLTGRCVHVDTESLVIDVGGVGYLVRATAAVLRSAARTPDAVTVFVHTSVRDDAIQLFGFASATEQAVYERLVQLQGVGPKVAVAILGVLSPSDVRRAADRGDDALLRSVPGVGPKVARRIVTELSGKLGDVVGTGETVLTATVHPGDVAGDDAREALVGLGLSPLDAEAALAATDPDLPTAERVRAALRGAAVRT